MKRYSFVFVTMMAAALIGGSAFAKDIYVSVEAGDNSNPGTKQAPVKLLWKAIAAANEGDVIHVAQGNYPGEGKGGCQPKIQKSNIQILGGYAKDFSKRDPFTYFTTVIAPEDSNNKCRGSTFHAEVPNGVLDGIVIDGFVVDRGPLNIYKSDGSQDNSKSPNGAPAIQLIGKGSFKVVNNIILNGAYIGIYVKCAKDSEIRNNLVFSTIGRSIEAIAGSGWGKPTITVANNTSAFSYKFRSTEGRGVLLDNIASYKVQNNLFAFNDESGVGLKFAHNDVEMDGNLFFFNKYGDVVIGGQGGKRIPASEFGDELSMKSASKNVYEDPKLALDKAWMEKWMSRKDAVEGKVTYDALNNLRGSFGLPLTGAPGLAAENYAVRYGKWMDLVKWVGARPQGVQRL